jgi:hypothetical protein
MGYGGAQVLNIDIKKMQVTFVAHRGFAPYGSTIYYIATIIVHGIFDAQNRYCTSLYDNKYVVFWMDKIVRHDFTVSIIKIWKKGNT